MTNYEKASRVLPRPLSDYELNPEFGFVPNEDPLRRLPNDGPFDHWERTIEDMHALLLTGRLRASIEKMPVIPADALTTVREQRRAYQVLSMLTQTYIWGMNEPVSSRLPASLAVPLCQVADMLDIRPIVTNSGTVTWNWRRLDPTGPCTPDNLMTLNTFTGSMDEAWFFTVTAAVEARGGAALYALLAAAAEALSPQPDLANMARCLNALGDEIGVMVTLLARIRANCDPHVFYNKIRIYLAGWSNLNPPNMPGGVHYEGVDEPGVYRQYSGASAGQSTLMHALDIGLDIEHKATGSPNGKNQYIGTMRYHVPGRQRAFLCDLQERCNIRGFVRQLEKIGTTQHSYNPQEIDAVVAAYDRCVQQLYRFRERHIQLVTVFILTPARKRRVQTDLQATNEQPVAATRPPLPVRMERPVSLANETPSGNSTASYLDDDNDNDNDSCSSSATSFILDDSDDEHEHAIYSGMSTSSTNFTQASSDANSNIDLSTLMMTANVNTTATIIARDNEGKEDEDGGHEHAIYSGVATPSTIFTPASSAATSSVDLSTLMVTVNVDTIATTIARDSDSEEDDDCDSDSDCEKRKQSARGTGGTDIMPFLRQLRDETRAALLTNS